MSQMHPLHLLARSAVAMLVVSSSRAFAFAPLRAPASLRLRGGSGVHLRPALLSPVRLFPSNAGSSSPAPKANEKDLTIADRFKSIVATCVLMSVSFPRKNDVRIGR